MSFVCVTRDRPGYVRAMVEQFENSTWSPRELVVVDDSREPVRAALPREARYVRLPPGPAHAVGAKRMIGVDAASGTLITWHDDDDWYHPRKVETFAEPLLSGAADVCGPSAAYWVDLPSASVHRYVCRTGVPVSGGVVFRRECVGAHPIPSHYRVGSDTFWLQELKNDPRVRMRSIEFDEALVAVSHGANLCNRTPPGERLDLSLRALASMLGVPRSQGLIRHLRLLAHPGSHAR